MDNYTMFELMTKQSILRAHIKTMKKLDKELYDLVEMDKEVYILRSIHDVNDNILKCCQDIKTIVAGINSHCTAALDELEEVEGEKDLNSILITWDQAREDNAAALAEGKLPVINDVDDVDPYVATGEAEQNG